MDYYKPYNKYIDNNLIIETYASVTDKLYIELNYGCGRIDEISITVSDLDKIYLTCYDLNTIPNIKIKGAYKQFMTNLPRPKNVDVNGKFNLFLNQNIPKIFKEQPCRFIKHPGQARITSFMTLNNF